MKLIPLTNSPLFAIVDNEDYEKLMKVKWQLQINNGSCKYAVHYHKKTTEEEKTKELWIMHRIVMNAPKGDRKIVVDHIDGNGLNNQKSNLRIVSQAVNSRNKKKRHNSESKYKGVTRYSRYKGKWIAFFWSGNQYQYLGIHNSEESAGKAYDIAVFKAHGSDAYFNFGVPTIEEVNKTKHKPLF